jgi:molecular chaperone HscB
VITARQKDYFSFLGLPRKLNIDMADLEKRFRALSREFHPDYFVNAPVAERRRSLEQSSYLNDAYRTLKNAAARLEYLLGLEGLALKGPQDASKAVPPALLEEVFALNEELDEIRELREGGGAAEQWKERIARERAPIDAKREEHEAQLEKLVRRWDALVDAGEESAAGRDVLIALRERMLERSYINNLLAGIERELTT